jgi:hypothetical protein
MTAVCLSLLHRQRKNATFQLTRNAAVIANSPHEEPTPPNWQRARAHGPVVSEARG